ncbi:uncharacterized protein N7484_008732 [Penicillium longicatenatum]|uniref:uncharacterized protein n=1 Tax=Penicillium longicatenatum TaxID=1561947 RepID=UPI0025486A24|nr:uncharacterized protein N7484_008732 [Penicillium longicatenatum]KAJ5635419.1 hypothetical protein N7484_008732 [Penicillium longicatenatum]
MDFYAFSAKEYRDDQKLHVLLAATGSVATIKLPNIAEALCRHPSISLRIIVTQSAERFLGGQSLEQPILDNLRQINGVDAVYRDDDEWATPWTRGANILHIELRKWAHMLLISPLSANTMAKMSVGIADNLLLSVVRAWDTTGLVDQDFKAQKPRIFVAPAMNSAMWHQPITHQQLSILQGQWGWSPTNPEGWVTVLPPIDKPLACGDVGSGGMMDWRDIVRNVEEHLGLSAVQS